MRPLTYLVAVSLDGFIAGPGGDVSAFPVEGDHVDALVREWPDALPAHVHDVLGARPDNARFDAVVMGWRTYAVGLPFGVDSPYPHLEQVVITRGHAAADVPHAVRLEGDPLTAVRDLKARPGSGVWLAGGGALAGAVAAEIDRLVLKVNPVVLGSGTPLFGGAAAGPWRLTDSHAYASGVVMSSYERG